MMSIDPKKWSPVVLSALLALAVTAGTAEGRGKPKVKAADVVLKNAQVFTVDAARSWAQAVAVRDGKIVYVGTNDDVTDFEGGHTRVIDLRGRMVLPGFIDGHNHAYLRAEALFWVTVSGTDLGVYAQQTQEFLARHPDAVQVRGVNFNLNAVRNAAAATGKLPKVLLDEIVQRDIPAVFITGGHHEIWANSRAIQLAGVTKDTPNPLGAVIEKDPVTGEPTGIFREFGAQNLIISKLPFPDFTVDEYRQAILSFQEDLAVQRGVTSVLQPTHYPTDSFLEAIKQLDKENKLTVRYDILQWADETRGVSQIPDLVQRRKQYQGKYFKLDSIKIFGTGVASDLVWNQDVLNQTVNALDKAGFRVYTHVISNATVNNAILDAYEYNLNNGGRISLRHTITHVGNGAVPTVDRYAALGVRADGHPVPKAFFDAGVPSSSSSDYPVRDFFPQVRIRSGVLNGVPLETMIASHTINGAELIFAENETGSIEVGKAADLVVLDQNLFDLAPADIANANVVMTMFAGKDIYRNASFMSASYIALQTERFAERGALDRRMSEPLLATLRTVEHFESKQRSDKVVEHAQHFLQVLDRAEARSLIETEAYDTLKANANALIALWTGSALVSKRAPTWRGYDDEHPEHLAAEDGRIALADVTR